MDEAIIKAIKRVAIRLEKHDSEDNVIIPPNKIGISAGKYTLPEIAEMFHFLSDMIE